jgi:hypothetical protein
VSLSLNLSYFVNSRTYEIYKIMPKYLQNKKISQNMQCCQLGKTFRPNQPKTSAPGEKNSAPHKIYLYGTVGTVDFWIFWIFNI